MSEPVRPACYDECAEAIRRVGAAAGTELHIMEAPYVVVVNLDYEPFIATCPHGVTWIAEPTGEQIAQWVKDKTP